MSLPTFDTALLREYAFDKSIPAASLHQQSPLCFVAGAPSDATHFSLMQATALGNSPPRNSTSEFCRTFARRHSRASGNPITR